VLRELFEGESTISWEKTLLEAVAIFHLAR